MSAVLALLGATATGKSAIALELARAIGAEIVNADAFQLYRGLDIGTAKPDAAARRAVPHHLLDLLDPGESCSAGEFARSARAAIAEISARGRRALVVGGSGLYLRALLDGLADLPPVAPEAREDLARRLAEEGLETLRRELERVDPQTAARLAPRDTQRTLRALEVARSTGRPLSSWLAERRTGEPLLARRLGLTLERAVLYDRIEARVLDMTARGWPDEVAALLASGVRPEAPGFRAIGYREWSRHQLGELGFDETVDRIVRATRRYAKRQETWFRRERDVEWIDASEPEGAVAEIRRRLAVVQRGEA